MMRVKSPLGSFITTSRVAEKSGSIRTSSDGSIARTFSSFGHERHTATRPVATEIVKSLVSASSLPWCINVICSITRLSICGKPSFNFFHSPSRAFELRDGFVVAEQDGLIRRGRFPADLIRPVDQHHAFALQRLGEQFQLPFLRELQINRASATTSCAAGPEAPDADRPRAATGLFARGESRPKHNPNGSDERTVFSFQHLDPSRTTSYPRSRKSSPTTVFTVATKRSAGNVAVVQQNDRARSGAAARCALTIRSGLGHFVSSPRAVQPTTVNPSVRATRNTRGFDKPIGGRNQAGSNSRGLLDGRLRLRQLRLQPRDRKKICRIAVRVGMVFQQMPFAHDARRQFGMRRHPFADAKKRRLHARLPQQLEQRRGRARIRPVVERQRHAAPRAGRRDRCKVRTNSVCGNVDAQADMPTNPRRRTPPECAALPSASAMPPSSTRSPG